MPQPLRKAPEKLDAIIRLIDLVPPETHMPSVEETFAVITESEELHKRLHTRDWMDSKLKSAGFSEHFRECILARGVDSAVERYELIRTSRESLRRIINRPTHPMLGTRRVVVDRDGLIDLGIDELSSALLGVEARRIRQCVVCGRIFWATRITKTTCGPQCLNTATVRRWRENQETRSEQKSQLRIKQKIRRSPKANLNPNFKRGDYVVADDLPDVGKVIWVSRLHVRILRGEDRVAFANSKVRHATESEIRAAKLLSES